MQPQRLLDLAKGAAKAVGADPADGWAVARVLANQLAVAMKSVGMGYARLPPPPEHYAVEPKGEPTKVTDP